jgi:choline-sulfatase
VVQDLDEIVPWTDGETLTGLASGARRDSSIRMEYAAEGSHAPIVCLRQGKWKYVHCALDPPLLYDLEADPQELANLATDPAHASTAAESARSVGEFWDMPAFDAEVRQSQARRRVVYEALRNGSYFPWDYQPLQRASERYMRNHMNLDTLEESQRFPRGE